MNTDEYIKEVKLVHGDKYDYSKTIYNGSKKKLSIICPVHGEFLQTAYHHKTGSNCPKCATENTHKKQRISIAKFLEDANKKHDNKFEYNIEVLNNINDKIKIICPVHGEFEQIARNHLRGFGCSNCSFKKQLSTQEFIDDSNIIHNYFYDYSNVVYKNNKIKINIICPIHGEFSQKPNSHKNGHGCPQCNTNESKKLEIIDNFFINFKVSKEKKFEECKNVLPLPFDRYIKKLKLLIEYDGEQHFHPISIWGGEEAFLKTQQRDLIKTNFAINNGFNFIRIKYNENILDKLKEFMKKYNDNPNEQIIMIY
ncbi:hypothetical protein [Yersinia phage fHe-Yen9-04]|uniref:Phage protein n=1 Tax=Yersinia phage fHe-Yen9-04 TaxID=2052742 RepID=A0A2C9CX57_9CAUD|nr:endonuclease [Yersinia phage fHe-Yen9-04]SOK58400.1 hypothetical protein [Yersinia phage fHe-Yen9-04]VUE36169.1 hypothetical protein [Yersinia phage fHe-Yen9-04]